MNRIVLSALILAVPLALAACTAGPSDGAAPGPTAPAADGPVETALASAVSTLPTVTVYKSPSCGCCAAWADHLRESGFPVETVETADVQAVKARYGIPPALQSCHTAVVDGYVVEGHVPASDLERLLAERPDADGLAVPGMPVGSPGMEQGDTVEPYDVLLVDDGQSSVFASH